MNARTEEHFIGNPVSYATYHFVLLEEERFDGFVVLCELKGEVLGAYVSEQWVQS